MFPLPLLGILITLCIYGYMISLYRRVVVPAEKVELKDFCDIIVYHQNIWDQNPHFAEPRYIQETNWDEIDKVGNSYLNKTVNL